MQTQEWQDCLLSDEQVRFFDKNGYLILRKRVTGHLLMRLQESSADWIEKGLQAGEHDPMKSDYAFAKRDTGDVFFRVDYLYCKSGKAALDLLGSPAMLGIAKSLRVGTLFRLTSRWYLRAKEMERRFAGIRMRFILATFGYSMWVFTLIGPPKKGAHSL